DGVALAVEQMVNAAQQVDVVGTIVAAAAAAFHRPDLWKTTLPESQHMLRDAEIVGDLTDSTEGLGGFFQGPLPSATSPWIIHSAPPAAPPVPLLMRCLRIADGLNTITRRGEIGTSFPVFGLRPIRWPFLRTTKEPNEDNFTVSPRSRQSVISLSTNSTSADDSVRDRPTFWYTASHRSARVTVFPAIAQPRIRRTNIPLNYQTILA